MISANDLCLRTEDFSGVYTTIHTKFKLDNPSGLFPLMPEKHLLKIWCKGLLTAISMREAFDFLMRLIFTWTSSSINRTGAYGEPKITMLQSHHLCIRKSSGLGSHFFQRTHRPVFQIRSDFCTTQSGHSSYICGGRKCFRGHCEHLVIYARRCSAT